MKIGYEQTDKKIEIEIYDLKFEIKNVEKLQEFEDVKDNDLDTIKKMIETMLGEGAVEKINKKRKEDGYEEINSSIALNILLGIYKVYSSEYIDGVLGSMEKMENRVNNINRNTRRNYNRGNRRRYDRY